MWFTILEKGVRSEVQARAIAQHIACVIGMADTIGDIASINFAAAFYRSLGYGRSVKVAFDLGCNAIDLANLEDKAIPQLLALHTDPAQVVLITPNLAADQDQQDAYAAQKSQLESMQSDIEGMIRLQKVEQIDRQWEEERKSYTETTIEGGYNG